jgi:hypothetical protein
MSNELFNGYDMNMGRRAMEEQEQEDEPQRELRCKSCGSTDVRWRQQGGKWVLFSSKPGVEHVCSNAEGFDA